MRITIIGLGSMGRAIANGLYQKYDLEFVVRDIKKVENLKNFYNAPIYSIDNFNINNRDIILAVKPYALNSIADSLIGSANTIYSILAGTTIEKLKVIPSQSYIRAMPNISAKFKASTTIITGDLKRRERALEIFNAIGDTFWVETQKEIDIATAIAGSGPALLALVAESMTDGLVREGMRKVDATNITNSLFRGFSPLISKEHPAIIKDSVMSPAGTTANAYATLENYRVRSAFIEAVRSAFEVTQK